jgi:hypothetical protein
VPETAQGFQEDIFQTLLASQNQLYMPAQLLTESKEYLKVLELIVRYMKAGNGNGYLRKGANMETASAISVKLVSGLLKKSGINKP